MALLTALAGGVIFLSTLLVGSRRDVSPHNLWLGYLVGLGLLALAIFLWLVDTKRPPGERVSVCVPHSACTARALWIPALCGNDRACDTRPLRHRPMTAYAGRRRRCAGGGFSPAQGLTVGVAWLTMAHNGAHIAIAQRGSTPARGRRRSGAGVTEPAVHGLDRRSMGSRASAGQG